MGLGEVAAERGRRRMAGKRVCLAEVVGLHPSPGGDGM